MEIERATIERPRMNARSGRARLDVAALFSRACCDVEARAAEANVRILVDSEPAPIFANEIELYTVVTGLLAHAIDSVAAGSALDVRTWVTASGDHAWEIAYVEAEPQRTGVEISVAAAIIAWHAGVLHLVRDAEGARLQIWLPGA